jgi:hypothetical protein
MALSAALVLAGGSARFGVGLHFLAVDGIDGVVFQEVARPGVLIETGEDRQALVERGCCDGPAPRGKAGKGLRDEGDFAALGAAAAVVGK